MGNPLVIEKEGKCLLVRHEKRCMALQIDKNADCLPESLACHFLKDDGSLHAQVLAPIEKHSLLVHRAVSYLGAYFRVDDRMLLEQEILRCVEDCLRQHRLGSIL